MENIEQIRHSLAHLLAMVVKEKYPEAKLGLGPAIENGFYYDFDLGEKSLTDTDLDELEKKMRSLISQNLDFATETITADKACEIFAAEPYKLELIDELEKNSESISIYRSGDFVDLCAGPHVANSSDIPRDSFRLDRLAGAYWRGNENNKMLTRVYGLAFTSKPELNDFLDKRAEAEKRDHRKLGKELDLFCFSDLVGPGLPLFTPKGTIIKEVLQKEVESICRHYGFEKVSAPSLAKQELFEISGHAKKFGEELFHVTSEKKHDLVLKPVQCPHHTQIYASKSRSYKDLPIRYMESDKQYRAEKTGEVSGLSRVYAITVEDGHSFCRVDQVKEEIKNMVSIIRDFYSRLGLWDEHWVSLSVRDYEHPEKYIGEPKDWDTCEQILQEVSNEMGLEAKRCEGEAALYGPKLDFMFKDATGREIQIPTVQIDFATPKRFNLEFTNEQGEKVPPVMVHRAILGSYERFLVLLIEHYAGAFPLWLSPVQAKILPISEKQMVYAKEILAELKARNIRVELDENNETLGKKIRNAKMEKIPYLLVVGDKEMESKTVTVEARGANKGESVSLAVFCAKIEEGLKSRK
ncbi:MAG TPA: threonine--tRNA ligase [Candidatus Paceibacterota bacterium]|jgi:threonyl-tRNA synthetase|nr:threonine--tRNA ligase [Candidatus Paceibacterota bacterium]HOH11091.1 threonine--tRNA ligase [Candidatus Paceibacterota bacterium]HOY11067.1 threonine--tRNA ligase [Candidatus Paceibacterota bacterium]HPI24707.1 threonine--tRNA ligase [Candidatus Paceibacterota bacterium]HPN89584.1 threonine--tRNA ligase [Candidatus Paceibacterota bacterium]